jgi:mevalonate kinase
MGKGLSSSAAVCVLVAKCFNEVCNRVVIKWC